MSNTMMEFKLLKLDLNIESLRMSTKVNQGQKRWSQIFVSWQLKVRFGLENYCKLFTFYINPLFV